MKPSLEQFDRKQAFNNFQGVFSLKSPNIARMID